MLLWRVQVTTSLSELVIFFFLHNSMTSLIGIDFQVNEIVFNFVLLIFNESAHFS